MCGDAYLPRITELFSAARALIRGLCPPQIHEAPDQIRGGAVQGKSAWRNAPPDSTKCHQHWNPQRKAEKLLPMTQALRNLAFTLSRLNLWIAALLVLGLLHDPHGALQSRLVQQISAQPVSVLTAAPKFALAKPTTPDTRARLTPLLDAAQTAAPAPPPSFHLLRQTSLPPVPRQSPSHSWDARAPPTLFAADLI